MSFSEDFTVVSVSPLRIRRDGDTDPLPFTPLTTVNADLLKPGDRVRADTSGGAPVITGRADGLPVSDTATPDTLVLRDGAGRAQVAAPSASSDIDTKGARDAAIDDLRAWTRFVPPTIDSTGSTATRDPASGVITVPAGCTGLRIDGILHPDYETWISCRLSVLSGHATNNSMWLRVVQATTVNSTSGYYVGGRWDQYDTTSGTYAVGGGNAGAIGFCAGSSTYANYQTDVRLIRARWNARFFFFFFESFTQESARSTRGGGYTPAPASGESDGVYIFPQGTSPVFQGEVIVYRRART